MKKKMKISYLVLAFAALGSIASGQGVLDAPVANLTERWTMDAAGWTSADPLCGWSNQALVFKCTIRGDTDPSIYVSKLIGGTNASSGHYVGNFSKIESVSFDAVPAAFSLKPNFYFKSRAGVTWRTQFVSALVGKPDGVAVNVTVPFSYSTNWWSGWSSAHDAHFVTDSSDIVEMGFEFVRLQSDIDAQQLAVDNLKLTGQWGGPFTNGVPVAWVMENGLPTGNLATVGAGDFDGDGYSNVAEYLAGTDPTNSADFFSIAIERNDAGKMVVKWKNNKYANVSYDLMEASDLTSTSAFVTISGNITGTASMVETNVDQEVTGARFYKVRINSKN